MKKINWIDSLKGIAMLMVIITHSGSTLLPGFSGKLGLFGQKGVQFFLIISAFLMMKSLNDRKVNSINEKKKWIKNKFIKLIPLYYLALLFGLLIYGFSERYWLGSLTKISFLNISSHLLFLHGLNPYYMNSIVGVEWYLGVLGIFFFIFPFIYKKINTLPKSIIFFSIATTVSYILYFIFMKKLVLPDWYIQYNYITYYSFIIEIIPFSIGIILYQIYKNFKFKNNILLSYSAIMVSIIVLLSLIKTTTDVSLLLISLSLGIIILSQMIYESKIINNKLFKLIGKYSYGIYLSHYFLIYFYNTYKIFNFDNIYLYVIVKVSVITIVSLSLSILLNKFIEKPIIKLITKNKTH